MGLHFVTAGPDQPIDEDGRLIREGKRSELPATVSHVGEMVFIMLFKAPNQYLTTRLACTAIKASLLNTEKPLSW